VFPFINLLKNTLKIPTNINKLLLFPDRPFPKTNTNLHTDKNFEATGRK
jgi:hypothetical protein